MLESGATAVLVVGPDEAAVRLRLDGRKLEGNAAIDTAIAAAEQLHGRLPQIVLVEGFRHADRPVVLVGTAKPDSEQDTILTVLPAVSSLDSQELERSLDQLAAFLRNRLG
jgi:molybdopterin-guanine dinucleotide biosynthesis protein